MLVIVENFPTFECIAILNIYVYSIRVHVGWLCTIESNTNLKNAIQEMQRKFYSAHVSIFQTKFTF